MMFYKDANEKIERFTQFFAYITVVATNILVLPSIFYTVVSYYFLDAGEESFFLFSPTWFVIEMIQLRLLK